VSECHSPGGDTAAALSDMAFYTTHTQSPQDDNAIALAEFALCECCCCYQLHLWVNISMQSTVNTTVNKFISITK